MEIGRLNRKNVVNQDRKIVSEKEIFLNALIKQEKGSQKNNLKKLEVI